MIYPHGFRVVIPHIATLEDGSSQYQYSNLHTNDPVDHRRIKRILRQWVKQNLDRTLDPITARLLYKSVTKHTQPMQYIRMQ